MSFLTDNPVAHGIGKAMTSLYHMTDLYRAVQAAADQHQMMQQQMAEREARLGMDEDRQQFNQGQTGYRNLAGALENNWSPVSQDVAQGGRMAGPQDQLAPGMIGVANVPPPGPGTIVTPFGQHGKQQSFYAPTHPEIAERSTQQAADKQRALNDANDVAVPDDVATTNGLKTGAKVPRQSYDTMLGRVYASKMAAASKGDKPDSQTFVPNMYGPNGGPIVFDKNSKNSYEVAVPK